MKILCYIIGIIILIIGSVLFYIYFFNQPCDEWEKPDNVPFSAVWIGGCDGGNWIELVSMKNDTCRFRIYRDWNGDLILDANFVYNNCGNFRLPETNWNEHIAYFDNKLHLIKKSHLGNCILIPIHPAYYEEKIE